LTAHWLKSCWAILRSSAAPLAECFFDHSPNASAVARFSSEASTFFSECSRASRASLVAFSAEWRACHCVCPAVPPALEATACRFSHLANAAALLSGTREENASPRFLRAWAAERWATCPPDGSGNESKYWSMSVRALPNDSSRAVAASLAVGASGVHASAITTLLSAAAALCARLAILGLATSGAAAAFTTTFGAGTAESWVTVGRALSAELSASWSVAANRFSSAATSASARISSCLAAPTLRASASAVRATCSAWRSLARSVPAAAASRADTANACFASATSLPADAAAARVAEAAARASLGAPVAAGSTSAVKKECAPPAAPARSTLASVCIGARSSTSPASAGAAAASSSSAGGGAFACRFHPAAYPRRPTGEVSSRTGEPPRL